MILHCKAILSQGQPELMRWKFDTKHAPGAGSISLSIIPQSNMLPVSYNCDYQSSPNLTSEREDKENMKFVFNITNRVQSF